MATYTPNDALTFAKTMVKSMPLNDTSVSYQMLDYVNSIMWTAAPWSWTLSALPAVPLVAGTQDYSGLTPTSFARLEYAYLTDGKTESPLRVDPLVPATTNTGVPTKVAALSGGTTLRVHPKPTANYTPNLVAIYKTVPAKIAAGNYMSALAGLPDHWFWVYQLGVLWLAYHYADDVQRAGLAQVVNNGTIQYTGMLGAFQGGLDVMRATEKLPLQITGDLGKING